METSTAVVIGLAVVVGGIVAYSVFKPSQNMSSNTQSGSITNQAQDNQYSAGRQAIQTGGTLLNTLLGGLLSNSSSNQSNVRDTSGNYTLQDSGGGRNSGNYRGAESWVRG